jgi:hypothetical protein
MSFASASPYGVEFGVGGDGADEAEAQRVGGVQRPAV